MSRHTPGPWGYKLGSIVDSEGFLIADVRSRFDAGKENEDYHHANARLIAAAPSMLSALEECITDHGAHCIGNGDLIALGKRLLYINSVARAAIASARGEL